MAVSTIQKALSEKSRAQRTIRREEEFRFGPQITRDGVRFRLWAPRQSRIQLQCRGREWPMNRLDQGWFECEVPGADAGDLYQFLLEDGQAVPDPASRFQPQDVFGPSEVIDPLGYEWRDLGWNGFPWEETVITEIHVGTFTPEGTFAAAARKLPLLKDAGINCVELMPLADFPGAFGWGYDGVLLFAPDSTYGRPEDLKAFIDTAHGLSMMVILDVVYNHFGPEGNLFPNYAPILSSRKTDYGQAINTDEDYSETAREFFLSNARYWLNEYRFDGLRLDAVHEIKDASDRHLLEELVAQLRATTDGRHTPIIVENADNCAGWLERRRDGKPKHYTAQWADDIHHALHAVTTGETFGYYADFENRVDLAARALAEGFGWQGEYLEHEGRHKGEPSGHLPPTAFVSFLQNHDHLGNRKQGERLSQLIEPQLMRALTGLLLLSPQIPLLFQGDEWGSSTPFCYFADFKGELADKVRQSRKEQLKDASHDPARGPAPDPISREAFTIGKLDWSERERERGRAMLAFHRDLLALRRREITPRLKHIGGSASTYRVVGPRAFHVQWRMGDKTTLHALVNLDRQPTRVEDAPAGDPLWSEGGWDSQNLAAHSVAMLIDDAPRT